jgi:hypothetical protein
VSFPEKPITLSFTTRTANPQMPTRTGRKANAVSNIEMATVFLSLLSLHMLSNDASRLYSLINVKDKSLEFIEIKQRFFRAEH